MTSSIPFPVKLNISHREVACFFFALMVHSLLLLWKGGMFNMPLKSGDALGDMLVQVNFMAEAPIFEEPGGTSPKPQGLFAKVKALLKGHSAEGKKAEQLATGAKTDQIKTQKLDWNKTDILANKAFKNKEGFQGIDKTKDMSIAAGQTTDIINKPSQGSFKSAAANLKENNFQVAPKDMPFPIVRPKTTDALSNVNAVPMVVGKTTSGSIKSLDGGPGTGPALQSKTAASKSFGSSRSSFGGEGDSGGSPGGGGTLLAMGKGSSQVMAGGGSLGGSGEEGSGYGTGEGSGTGSGRGNGVGSGQGTGRSYGAGSGVRGSSLVSLQRHSVEQAVGAPTSKLTSENKQGFQITGALAKRPILQKTLPAYESDARVGLRFRVDWSGQVLEGIIVEMSSGNPSFDQKVMTALKQWKFNRLSGNRSNEIQEGLITFVFKGV